MSPSMSWRLFDSLLQDLNKGSLADLQRLQVRAGSFYGDTVERNRDRHFTLDSFVQLLKCTDGMTVGNDPRSFGIWQYGKGLQCRASQLSKLEMMRPAS